MGSAILVVKRWRRAVIILFDGSNGYPARSATTEDTTARERERERVVERCWVLSTEIDRRTENQEVEG